MRSYSIFSIPCLKQSKQSNLVISAYLFATLQYFLLLVCYFTVLFHTFPLLLYCTFSHIPFRHSSMSSFFQPYTGLCILAPRRILCPFSATIPTTIPPFSFCITQALATNCSKMLQMQDNTQLIMIKSMSIMTKILVPSTTKDLSHPVMPNPANHFPIGSSPSFKFF